eukprot:scaffold992_cov116-Cylindrotheca_fusiformis.AAC.11
MRLSILSFVIFLQAYEFCSGFSIGRTAQNGVTSASIGTSLAAATSLPLEEFTAVAPKEEESNVGVLLLNLGGPEKTDDVEDIIRLPGPLTFFQNSIAYFISKRRAPKSIAAYDSIGGGSPILKYSNAQADLLKKSLKEKYNLSVNTYIGMRYWHPFTEEALEEIRKDKINALVIIPLYPQFSISTSGSSLRVLQEEFSARSANYGDMIHTVVPSWYGRPGYLKAVSDLIQTELNSFTEEEIAEAKKRAPHLPAKHILFSAHGVPRSYIDAGDPYKRQIEECVDKIGKVLYKSNSPDDLQIHLSYQSRVGPIEWLRPYTDDVLPELGQKGVSNLVVVPISFVSEHIETLEEIDLEYRELAEESGVTNWRRCPALNTDETFIEDMADMIYDALVEPAQTVTEACIANNVEGVDLMPLDTLDVSTTGVAGVGKEIDEALFDKERINARVAMAGVLLTLNVLRSPAARLCFEQKTSFAMASFLPILYFHSLKTTLGVSSAARRMIILRAAE